MIAITYDVERLFDLREGYILASVPDVDETVLGCCVYQLFGYASLTFLMPGDINDWNRGCLSHGSSLNQRIPIGGSICVIFLEPAKASGFDDA